MPDRWGMVGVVISLYDVTLDEAARLVDEYIPVEAYSAEGFEVPPDDVMTWMGVIEDEGLGVASS